jgi:hypothetical protein
VCVTEVRVEHQIILLITSDDTSNPYAVVGSTDHLVQAGGTVPNTTDESQPQCNRQANEGSDGVVIQLPNLDTR